MNVRTACPARGWLCCAAMSLMLIGPSMVRAQIPFIGGWKAKPNTAQSTRKQPNRLISAVEQESQSIQSAETKRSKTKAAPPKRKPGLLSFLGVPGAKTKTAKKAAPATRSSSSRKLRKPRSRDGRMSYRPYVPRKRSVEQTAARKPAAKPAQKHGIIDRLLGLDKPQARPSRVVRRPKSAPPKVARKTSGGFPKIPNLLPSFLRPKTQQPQITRRPQPLRYQPQVRRTPGQPPTMVLNNAEVTARRLGDLGNPFTEVTEAEADVKVEETPFSGLTLAEPEEFVQPEIHSASGTNDVEVTIQQRSTTAAADDLPLIDFAASKAEKNPHQDKMKKLAERSSQGGLKGFCPVALRDTRDLVDADDTFQSTHEEMTYHFSSAEAKAKFDAEPAKYAPARGGHDVIVLAEGDVKLEGSLENAVWFRDRLYLFSSAATLETFVENPEKYTAETKLDSADNAAEADEQKAEQEEAAPDFGDADDDAAGQKTEDDAESDKE